MLKETALYHPRDITLVTPRGDGLFEFLITSEDQVGALSKVTDVFAKHKVNLIVPYG